MALRHGRRVSDRFRLIPALAVLLLPSLALRLDADQVETQNGDRYVGKVLSVNADTLVLQSDVLGTVKLPRAKILHITLGTNSPSHDRRLTATNGILLTPSATNSNPELAASVRQLSSNSNLIQQVQSQFLNGAGPEAKAKFDELLGGFLSGKLSVDDIRVEAKTAADQLRSARTELGGDSGAMLDGYLAILDTFLKDTAPSTNTVDSKSTPLPANR